MRDETSGSDQNDEAMRSINYIIRSIKIPGIPEINRSTKKKSR